MNENFVNRYMVQLDGELEKTYGLTYDQRQLAKNLIGVLRDLSYMDVRIVAAGLYLVYKTIFANLSDIERKEEVRRQLENEDFQERLVENMEIGGSIRLQKEYGLKYDESPSNNEIAINTVMGNVIAVYKRIENQIYGGKDFQERIRLTQT